MSAVLIALGSGVILYLGYRIYGRFLGSEVLPEDPDRPTPAHEHYDGVDFYPARRVLLFGHHFSSIAGAGPIVGPILAIVQWGWMGVLGWLLLGSIFIGGVHDYLSLRLSVRHKGASIGEISERVMSPTARIIFSLFLLLALILVIAVFGILAAQALIKQPEIVLPTFALIIIALLLGWMAYVKNISLAISTPLAVLFMFGAIYCGYLNPLWLPSEVLRPELTAGRKATAQRHTVQALQDVGVSPATAQELVQTYPLPTIRSYIEAVPFQEEATAAALVQALQENAELPQAYQNRVKEEEGRQTMVWFWVLMGYCLIASVLPVWLLLQPRDYINVYKLVIGMFLGFLAVVIGGLTMGGLAMTAPAFTSFQGAGKGTPPLWPMLFVITACGATSGFHSLVASGTTAKQLNNETEARFIGYGGMLLESALGVLALIAVGAGLYWKVGPVGGEVLQNLLGGPGALVAFAHGYGHVIAKGLPFLGFAAGSLFGMIMLKTFVLTSLDTCTRLARFVFAELFGHLHPVLRNRWVASVIVLLPAGLLGATNSWRTVWPVFGSANQLMAALALMVISCYLVGVRRPSLYALVPALFMCLTTIGALIYQTYGFLTHVEAKTGQPAPQMTLAVVAVLLTILAGWVLVEGARSFTALRRGDERARGRLESVSAS